MPGNGKSLGQFQQDDASCRNYASAQTGGVQPADAANQSAVGSAVLGTALGAAAGAALGAAAGNAGMGAAIGAGAGLLGGASVGANNAQASAYSVQDRYDIAYSQCMSANGNRVPAPAQASYAAPVYAAPPAVVYAPPPAYYYPPPYYGPTVVIGGGGYHHWHRY
jgi:uncharacterized protein YcfJ